jgi:hypothetical protein
MRPLVTEQQRKNCMLKVYSDREIFYFVMACYCIVSRTSFMVHHTLSKQLCVCSVRFLV